MTRTWQVSDLVARLQPDPWRRDHRPFAPDIARCHAALFDNSRSRQEKADALAAWLAESQPCLFGQMEARQRRLAFCILTENDLEASDQDIRRWVVQAQTEWRRQALEGKSPGFLIVAVSPAIAFARPGRELRELALRLCESYLGIADLDAILHDSLILEIGQGEAVERRTWKVGVNYFSAQGDGRWWHDHRIPGGLAFSMNSVGHMARAAVEREKARDAGRAARFDNDVRAFLLAVDGIFCYITDDVAYANRITTDLTVFRNLDDHSKITGFKVKNVRRILEENKSIVLNEDPDDEVRVESALLATLKGHKDADMLVYQILIEAFKKVDVPPTVHVPKRPAVGSTRRPGAAVPIASAC
jgi:hypothetical protein